MCASGRKHFSEKCPCHVILGIGIRREDPKKRFLSLATPSHTHLLPSPLNRSITYVRIMDHFVHNHESSSWLVQGFHDVSPTDEGTYFRVAACKYDSTKFDELVVVETSSENRAISVCIPCFNEEAEALKRTLASLQEQRLPSTFTFELVIVMDGVEKMSESMRAHLNSLFGGSLGHANDEDDVFQRLPTAETIVLEAINQSHYDLAGSAISLVVKRNNQRKVNSHMWWLGAHAKDTCCELVFATDCGIVFEKNTIEKLLSRLEQDPGLVAVTGFQRYMSSSMQGDGSLELFTDPMGYVLRHIQKFDFEVRSTLSAVYYLHEYSKSPANHIIIHLSN